MIIHTTIKSTDLLRLASTIVLRNVTNILTHAFIPYRFSLVGYGCMTCIGNSGPLAEPIVEAIEKVIIYWDIPCMCLSSQ